jgi:hypothetical protein
MPEVERAPHRTADVVRVDVDPVRPPCRRDREVTTAQDVRRLGQPLQVVDLQTGVAVDRQEPVARIRPRLPAVALSSPLQFRDHVHDASRPD